MKVTAIGDSIVLGIECKGRTSIPEGTLSSIGRVKPRRISTYLQAKDAGKFGVALRNLCHVVGELQSDLAKVGLWTRGAVTYDYLQFEKERIVGPAFSVAYNLEKHVAKFPRVILDGRVIRAGRWRTADEMIKGINQTDAMGPLLYCYTETEVYGCGSLPRADTEMQLIHDVPTFVNFIRFCNPEDLKFITLKLQKAMQDSVEHYGKYRWLADYILQHALTLRGNPDIEAAVS